VTVTVISISVSSKSGTPLRGRTKNGVSLLSEEFFNEESPLQQAGAADADRDTDSLLAGPLQELQRERFIFGASSAEKYYQYVYSKV